MKSRLSGMQLRSAHILVIPIAVLVFLQPPRAEGQPPAALEPIVDTDTYAVYGPALLQVWTEQSKYTLPIAEQTAFYQCKTFRVPAGEWQSAWDSYARENRQPRRLLRMLPEPILYRLIPRADIVAEGARLKELYPGIWQHRPGEID